MTDGEYRIDYTITYRGPEDDDFREIGFGASTARATVDEAADEVAAFVQNRLWETDPGMPEPEAAPK
jgi:hypothetical protein